MLPDDGPDGEICKHWLWRATATGSICWWSYATCLQAFSDYLQLNTETIRLGSVIAGVIEIINT